MPTAGSNPQPPVTPGEISFERAKDETLSESIHRLAQECATLAAPNALDPLTPDQIIDQDVAYTKGLRVGLDAQLQRLKCGTRQSRERSLARTRIEEAIMWLGMDLKALNEMRLEPKPSPYPSSYDPKSPKVEPPSGVKL